MSIGKTELVSRVAREAGIPQRQAERVVNSMINEITDSLRRGEEVKLTGFGSFKVIDRAARKGRHPRTGQEMQIPSSRRPAFTPGSRLIEAGRESSGSRSRKAA